MKILLNLFLCIHDDRKWFHQKPKATHSFCLSVQCLIDFEEIIVIFVVRWNVPFEMWKRAVWKYWTVWTKNTIKLCTLNVEGKSSQLRAKMTHYKTWLVHFFVSFFVGVLHETHIIIHTWQALSWGHIWRRRKIQLQVLWSLGSIRHQATQVKTKLKVKATKMTEQQFQWRWWDSWKNAWILFLKCLG